MNCRLPATSLTMLLCSLSAAQVIVQNPQHLEIPEQRVQMLHTTICRVVSEEFHTRRENAEGPLILVLGEETERSETDELHRAYTIYLNRWNQQTFVLSDLRLAVQRLTRDRLGEMERKVIRRVNSIAPVDMNSLRGSH